MYYIKVKVRGVVPVLFNRWPTESHTGCIRWGPAPAERSEASPSEAKPRSKQYFGGDGA